MITVTFNLVISPDEAVFPFLDCNIPILIPSYIYSVRKAEHLKDKIYIVHLRHPPCPHIKHPNFCFN